MWRPRLTGSGAALMVAAAPAQAHSPMPGIEGFYVGFLHPLTQPTQLMLLVAAGVFLGTKASAVKAGCLGLLALGAVAGLAFGVAAGATADRAPLLAGAVIVLAAGTLYPRQWPDWASLGLAAGTGLLLGLACVPDPGRWRDIVVTALGSWVGISYFALLTVGATVELLRRWPGIATRIGVQVAAAWLIAMASLYVAFLVFAPDALVSA